MGLTAIPSDFGTGGSNLSPDGAAGAPTLQAVLAEHKAALDAIIGGAEGGTEIVRAASTANLTLSGTQTIDAVAVIAGDRVLAKDQTTAADRAIYLVAAGAWTKVTNADGSSILKEGLVASVAEGTTNGSKIFLLASDLTTWNAGTTASLSAATPAAVAAAGAAGSAGTASKSDHAHADPNRAVKGTDLTNTATQTIATPGTGWRVLPTLGQGGALTVGVTGAVAGDQLDIVRTDASAFTYDIIDGGPGTPTLIQLPASKKMCVKLQFDGTNWKLRFFGAGF
jgi:phage-related tail fiber protein